MEALLKNKLRAVRPLGLHERQSRSAPVSLLLPQERCTAKSGCDRFAGRSDYVTGKARQKALIH